MHSIEVGKLYVEGKTFYPEAVEWNWTSKFHELRLFFHNPSSQEIQAVKKGKVEFGLVVGSGVLFLVFRFLPAFKGQSGIHWSDAPYSYHMLPEELRELPEQDLSPTRRSVLLVVLVNASIGITLAIREVSLSPAFTQRLYQEIQKQAEFPFDQEKYDLQLQTIYKFNDSKKLAAQAVVHCFGGE